MFEFIELFSELGVYLGNYGKAGNAGARKILKRSPRVTFCIQEDWSIGLNDFTKTRVHLTHAYQDTILTGDPTQHIAYARWRSSFFSVIQNGSWRLMVYLFSRCQTCLAESMDTRQKFLLGPNTGSVLVMVLLTFERKGIALHWMGYY